MSTLIVNEKGAPILEQQDGITMPANYSFECINNFVHCESPQYEDLENLALGMSLHIEALKKENERLRGLAITAEKWRGIATAKFGDGRTVSEIEREACEAIRKENEKLRERIAELSVKKSEDEMRADFEKWAKNNKDYCTILHVFSLARHPNEPRYYEFITELCFQAWKAALKGGAK